MNVKSVLIICSFLALTGCLNSDGSFFPPGSPAWRMEQSPAQQKAYWAQVCQNYGFKIGTSDMAQCIQKESTGR